LSIALLFHLQVFFLMKGKAFVDGLRPAGGDDAPTEAWLWLSDWNDAVAHGGNRGNRELLISKGADLNVRVTSGPQKGKSHLMVLSVLTMANIPKSPPSFANTAAKAGKN